MKMREDRGNKTKAAGRKNGSAVLPARLLMMLAAILLCGILISGCRAAAPGPEPSAAAMALTAVGEASAPAGQAEPSSGQAEPSSGQAEPLSGAELTEDTDANICLLSISCAAILARPEACAPETLALVPEDGWILPPSKVRFDEGDSAFDVLKDECRRRGIHMEFSITPAYGTAYVEGIGNIYEMDAGSLSGWTYTLNGEFKNYSASECLPAPGDELAWQYTCELGADLGGGWDADADNKS